MLLKIRSALELLKLCPGILSRVGLRGINTEFRYAAGLRRIRHAPREQQPYLNACIMLHELHEQGQIRKDELTFAGRLALRDTQDYYRKQYEARHRHVLDEVRARGSLNADDSILHEIREHTGT